MSEQIPAEATDAAVAYVRAVHGRHIPAGQEERLRAAVTAIQQALQEVNAFPLTNADEPVQPFAAFRRD